MSFRRVSIRLSLLLFLSFFCIVSAANAQAPLTLRVHPYLAASELVKRFVPLADYLSREIGRPVVVSISKNYRDHIDQIGRDKADIAYMGPVPYVRMVEKYGKKPLLARLEINGAPTFRGVIITAKNSSVRSLSDLKGKRFAFGDPNSTMSHIVPRFLMLQAGVTVKDLAGHAFLRNHSNVVLGVLIGDFDAGAVKDEVFYEYEQRGLRAVTWTPPISEHLFVTRRTLPSKTIKALRKALYALEHEKEGKAIMSKIEKNMTGMVPARDEDYDNLRVILKELKRIGVNP